MEHCLAAGLSPLEVIQTATINAAKLINSDCLGEIKVGRKADFICVESNPLENISHLRNICFVMQDGRVIRDDRE